MTLTTVGAHFLVKNFDIKVVVSDLAKKASFDNKEKRHTEFLKDFSYSSIGDIPLSASKQSSQPSGNKLEKTFTLEFRVARKKADAKALVEALKSKGIDAFFTPIQKGPEVVFRIRRGIFAAKDLALKASKDLARAQGVKTRVVSLN